jgi:hypothetical protein
MGRTAVARSVATLTKRRVAARAEWRCAGCGVCVDEHYEIDHRVPLHLGGSNEMSNLDLLCSNCHHTKTRTEAIEREPWLSIAYCRRCHRTYSRYFRCGHGIVRKRSARPLASFARGWLRTMPGSP